MKAKSTIRNHWQIIATALLMFMQLTIHVPAAWGQVDPDKMYFSVSDRNGVFLSECNSLKEALDIAMLKQDRVTITLLDDYSDNTLLEYTNSIYPTINLTGHTLSCRIKSTGIQSQFTDITIKNGKFEGEIMTFASGTSLTFSNVNFKGNLDLQSESSYHTFINSTLDGSIKITSDDGSYPAYATFKGCDIKPQQGTYATQDGIQIKNTRLYFSSPENKISGDYAINSATFGENHIYIDDLDLSECSYPGPTSPRGSVTWHFAEYLKIEGWPWNNTSWDGYRELSNQELFELLDGGKAMSDILEDPRGELMLESIVLETPWNPSIQDAIANKAIYKVVDKTTGDILDNEDIIFQFSCEDFIPAETEFEVHGSLEISPMRWLNYKGIIVEDAVINVKMSPVEYDLNLQIPENIYILEGETAWNIQPIVYYDNGNIANQILKYELEDPTGISISGWNGYKRLYGAVDENFTNTKLTFKLNDQFAGILKLAAKSSTISMSENYLVLDGNTYYTPEDAPDTLFYRLQAQFLSYKTENCPLLTTDEYESIPSSNDYYYYNSKITAHYPGKDITIIKDDEAPTMTSFAINGTGNNYLGLAENQEKASVSFNIGLEDHSDWLGEKEGVGVLDSVGVRIRNADEIVLYQGLDSESFDLGKGKYWVDIEFKDLLRNNDYATAEFTIGLIPTVKNVWVELGTAGSTIGSINGGQNNTSGQIHGYASYNDKEVSGRFRLISIGGMNIEEYAPDYVITQEPEEYVILFTPNAPDDKEEANDDFYIPVEISNNVSWGKPKLSCEFTYGQSASLATWTLHDGKDEEIEAWKIKVYKDNMVTNPDLKESIPTNISRVSYTPEGQSSALFNYTSGDIEWIMNPLKLEYKGDKKIVVVKNGADYVITPVFQETFDDRGTSLGIHNPKLTIIDGNDGPASISDDNKIIINASAATGTYDVIVKSANEDYYVFTNDITTDDENKTTTNPGTFTITVAISEPMVEYRKGNDESYTKVSLSEFNSMENPWVYEAAIIAPDAPQEWEDYAGVFLGLEAENISFNSINHTTEGSSTLPIYYTGCGSSYLSWNVNIDRTAPTAGDIKVEQSPFSVTLTEGSDGVSGVAKNEYKLEEDNGDALPQGSTWKAYPKDKKVPLSGDDNGKTYTVFVRSIDNAGNVSDTKSETFTVPYSITYFNGTAELKGITPTSYLPGETVTLPTTGITPGTDYEFAGWTDAEKNTVESISADDREDKKFYVKWKAIDYKITYDLNGGTNAETNPKTYTVEDEVTLLAPTRSGYNFVKWTEGSKIEKGSTGKKTFTAEWSDPIEYTITLYPMEGILADGENTITYTVLNANTIELPTPTRNGYNFLGWYDNDNNKVETITFGNMALAAVWEEKEITITYLVDGVKYTESKAKYGASVPSIATPTEQGLFSGWSNNLPETMPAEDITVTGIFMKELTSIELTCDQTLEKVNLGDYCKFSEGSARPAPGSESNVSVIYNPDPEKYNDVESTILVSVANHEPETDPAVDPTCETSGKTEGSHCKVCNETLKQQEEVRALGHSWGEPSYNWSTDSTECTITIVCNRDEEHKKTMTVPVAPVIENATCTETGSRTFTANFKFGENEVYEDSKKSTLPALGHSWGEPSYNWSTDSTKCTITIVCNRDEEHKKTMTVPVAPVIENATCTEPGSRTFTAIFKFGENEVYEDSKKSTIPALGHSMGDWVTTKEASYTEKGEQKRYCQNDKNHVETQEIEKLKKATVSISFPGLEEFDPKNDVLYHFVGSDIADIPNIMPGLSDNSIPLAKVSREVLVGNSSVDILTLPAYTRETLTDGSAKEYLKYNGQLGKWQIQYTLVEGETYKGTSVTINYELIDVNVEYQTLQDGKTVTQKANLSELKFNTDNWININSLSATSDIEKFEFTMDGNNVLANGKKVGSKKVGSINAKIDNDKPSVSIKATASNDDTEYTVTFTGSDKTSGVAAIEYSLNNGNTKTVAATDNAATINIDTPGKYEIKAWAIDKAGNKTVTPATSQFTVKGKPEITNVEISGTFGDKLGDFKVSGTAKSGTTNVNGKFEIVYTDNLQTSDIVTGKIEGITIKFTPKDTDNYATVTAEATKDSWNIQKRKLSISASESNISLIRGRSKTIEASLDSDQILEGTSAPKITATCADNGLRINGMEITATKEDSYSITVAIEENDNYYADPVTISATAKALTVNFLQEESQYYCYGDMAEIKLIFPNGNMPAKYKTGNGSFMDMKGDGHDGTISFPIDEDTFDEGSNSLSIVFAEEEGVESNPSEITVNVNVSSDKMKLLYNDIIFIDNSDGSYTSYQWYKNGTKLEGDTLQYLQEWPAITKGYTADVTDINGNTMHVCPANIEGNSLQKSAAMGVSVYPNPARSGQEITIEVTNAPGSCQVYIYNNMGSLIRTLDASQAPARTWLPAGSYSGQAVSNGSKASFKIIVE